MATFLSTKYGLHASAISVIHVTFIRMTVYCSSQLVTNTLPVPTPACNLLHILYSHVQNNLPTHFL